MITPVAGLARTRTRKARPRSGLTSTTRRRAASLVETTEADAAAAAAGGQHATRRVHRARAPREEQIAVPEAGVPLGALLGTDLEAQGCVERPVRPALERERLGVLGEGQPARRERATRPELGELGAATPKKADVEGRALHHGGGAGVALDRPRDDPFAAPEVVPWRG